MKNDDDWERNWIVEQKKRRWGIGDYREAPPEALELIEPYLDPEQVIWDPACGRKKTAAYFEAHGFKPFINTDLITNQDFYRYLPDEHFDLILTAPPFSKPNITGFIARCYELKVPFALLVPHYVVDTTPRQKMFVSHCPRPQYIIPSERVEYDSQPAVGSDFCSVWITYGLNLPREVNYVVVE